LFVSKPTLSSPKISVNCEAVAKKVEASTDQVENGNVELKGKKNGKETEHDCSWMRKSANTSISVSTLKLAHSLATLYLNIIRMTDRVFLQESKHQHHHHLHNHPDHSKAEDQIEGFFAKL